MSSVSHEYKHLTTARFWVVLVRWLRMRLIKSRRFAWVVRIGLWLAVAWKWLKLARNGLKHGQTAWRVVKGARITALTARFGVWGYAIVAGAILIAVCIVVVLGVLYFYPRVRVWVGDIYRREVLPRKERHLDPLLVRYSIIISTALAVLDVTFATSLLVEFGVMSTFWAYASAGIALVLIGTILWLPEVYRKYRWRQKRHRLANS